MDDFFSLEPIGRKSRYREKPYTPNGIYHVFNRREDCEPVFADDVDKGDFIDAIKRLAQPDRFRDERGRRFAPLGGDVRVLAFCVLDEHYHQLLWQDEWRYGVAEFMKRQMNSYAMKFNRRHGRSGPVFDMPYQAVPVTSRLHLKRLIPYIHANPEGSYDAGAYRWSSHEQYCAPASERASAWCDVAAGLSLYGGRDEYMRWFERAVAERRKRNRETELLRRERRGAAQRRPPRSIR